MMQAGPIEREELASFLSLLLPEVGAEIASGRPMLVLGLTDGLPEKRVACGAAAGEKLYPAVTLCSAAAPPLGRRPLAGGDAVQSSDGICRQRGGQLYGHKARTRCPVPVP